MANISLSSVKFTSAALIPVEHSIRVVCLADHLIFMVSQDMPRRVLSHRGHWFACQVAVTAVRPQQHD